MKTYILLLALLPGCGGGVIGRHFDMRNKEIEYRHQERMRELDLQERRLRQEQQQQGTSPAIVREAPF